MIECSEHYNWPEIFGAGAHIVVDGAAVPVCVEQTTFPDMSITSYHQGGAVVTLRKGRPGASAGRTVQVDFVLLRSVSRGVHGQDSRNLLLALMHAGVPAVNSLLSAYMALERPVMWGQLRAVQERLGGPSQFPLVAQDFHARPREMAVSPDLPCVVKVAHAHAGHGKVLVRDAEQWDDVRSLLALHGDYATAEPYVPADSDARVQKIGRHYRAFSRTSPNWKMNQGHSSVVSEVPVPPEWRRWADECASCCGGLDILGLDLVHDRATGRYSVLELNDTAIGLVHAVAQEDNAAIRDLVLFRMTQHFNTPPGRPSPIPGAYPPLQSLSSPSFTSLNLHPSTMGSSSAASIDSSAIDPSSSSVDDLPSSSELPSQCLACEMTLFQLEAAHRRIHRLEADLAALEDREPPHTKRMLALSGFVGAVLASVSILSVALLRSWRA
ncbi:MAG: hypothetical protein Q8P67_10370 [archaeon]|nr:hypothetical protein [archaeon]